MDAKAVMDAVVSLFSYLGVPISLKKLLGPSDTMIFLGIGLCSTGLFAFVPNDKRDKCIKLLQHFLSAKSCTVNELQSLLGTLYFLTRVVRSGRAFLGRMMSLEGFEIEAEIENLSRRWLQIGYKVVAYLFAHLGWYLPTV